MTTENLEQANRLRQTIDELIVHRKYVATDLGKDAYEHKETRICVKPNPAYSDRTLRPAYLPLPIQALVDMYLIKVDEKIKELETEFSKL